MSMSSRRLHRTITLVCHPIRTGLALALVAASVGIVAPARAASTDAAESASGEAVLLGLSKDRYELTLITGDRVSLTARGGGRFAIDVEPAPRADGSTPLIEVTSTRSPDNGHDVYAVPADAVRHIASGQLDRELFNVGYLAANGYTGEGLPVIIEYDERLPTSAGGSRLDMAQADADLPVTARLESINAAGVTLSQPEAANIWAGIIDGTAGDTAAAATTLPGGIERIWLDRVMEVALDESRPQIGTPEAWAAGYDGTGVDVAVLDTGIDPTHPDLANKIIASRSFVAGAAVRDGHGHGTHVASILTGTGAASDGTYTGIAPGADLIVGKVLGDNGIGLMSDVIDGMEWAAIEQDADVINLSLGSDPTDGTDPASQAVNTLTETTGALFVIAAGNLGPRTFSVGTPAAAESALAVGAVDSAEALASFSSRGPRIGDHAIKPEITAPGVNIVAARAAGTRRGTPVDAFHTTLSGTSMATPHVAGAAAILAQQRPGWSAEELKAALIATAHDGGHTVYEQGGGRVDVARATQQDIRVTPATANFALLPSPPDGMPRTRTLTYTNSTSDAVTLDLVAAVRNVNGDAVADGALTVEPSALTVPANATATMTVTLTADGLATGLYSGSIVATAAGDLRLSTPVGFAVGEQAHHVQITVVDRADVRAFEFVNLLIYGVDGPWAGESISCSASTCPQSLEFLLAKGTYSVRALVAWQDDQGERQLASLLEPELQVTDDGELVVDANAAERITVHTDRPSEVRRVSSFSLYRSSSDGAFQHINLVFAGDRPNWWVTPTDQVDRGGFAIATHWLLAQPTTNGSTPAYLYQLKLIETGGVPDSLAYALADRDLVRVDNRYHADSPGAPYEQRWFTWAPWEFAVAGVSHPVAGQTAMREYVAPAGADYIHERGLHAAGVFQPIDETMDVYGRPARHEVRWNERPQVPGAVVLPSSIAEQRLSAPLWWWVCAACRQGDNFYPFMHLTAAGERNTLGQYGRPFGTGEMHLYRDGVEVPQAPPYIFAFTTYTLPPEPAAYRLTLDAGNTNTAWDFTSSRPEADATPPGHRCVETEFDNSTTPCRAEPLLFLRYDVGVGMDNRVPVPGGQDIAITVYRQDQSAPAPVAGGLRLWISTDDGAAWQEMHVKGDGAGRYHAQFDLPPIAQTTGQVSIRAEAWDANGSRIEQTVIGAFGLRDRTGPLP